MKNKDRAERAEKSLKAYAPEVGLSPDLDEPDTMVTDLITDLMHYCDWKEISFNMVLFRAEDHYREEVK